jgi:hypothetical protein
MSISSDGAMALAYAFQVPCIKKAAPGPRREFDRSKVFMVMKQNFDQFTRLTVVMDGGHRFEIDSDKVPFNIDRAADWLVGES